MKYLNLILDNPFGFTIIYLIIGILLYWMLCYFKKIKHPDSTDLVLIIFWPLFIIVFILYIISHIIAHIIAPVINFGKKLSERNK